MSENVRVIKTKISPVIGHFKSPQVKNKQQKSMLNAKDILYSIIHLIIDDFRGAEKALLKRN